MLAHADAFCEYNSDELVSMLKSMLIIQTSDYQKLQSLLTVIITLIL